MSLHVFLVRHAQSVWHDENRYAGATDIDLTPYGHGQADRLADWAGHAGLTAVRSSPMRRCRATAEQSAARAGLPLGLDPRLRELDFGVAEGLTRTEMRRRMPKDLDAFEDDPVGHHFPGGEDPLEAGRRYLDFLDELRTEHPDGRVLVVAHSTAIRLTLCRLLGLPLRDYRRLFPYLANCALNELVLRDGVPALLALNKELTPGAAE
ncbi:histidine phosphatase family protein [Streptomyces triticagri]|uniref:Histidine phosphatase family protein n=1 Tax=Streptomyces triticagri TaxID=2293568 RepID=A0A372LZW8_9ACTN|nr:histidine phosphatase family protein [Streptomyces triticagri]RFU83910.1 histidine phosphatase family protein [Streptomyces triticagri]